MISLAKVLSGKPILLTQDIYFYQPTLQEIVNMGESSYWNAINLWTIKRNELLTTETDETKKIDDFEIWKAYIMSSDISKQLLALSCGILLKSKIEFFDISNTIYIGEKGSGIILDNTFYFLMREVCSRVIPSAQSDSKGQQYQETEGMSDMEKRMIEKMRASEKKLEDAKRKDDLPENFLGNKILGLVAVGNYTFEQVYNMTMLQFNLLLQKCVDIQSYEIRAALSPYISSEEGQENNFWLD